jgi:hypothetical protein
VSTDPIAALESLGYTGREAAFLYLVAAHSGYFLRRQFDYFTDRNKGALVMRFLRKACAARHVEVLDYGQGWHVYHLAARTIYRLVGDVESQNRRRKGDAQIRARLMALDYVLEQDGDRYLESEADKARFFIDSRGIAPKIAIADQGRLHPLLASIPIAITDPGSPRLSLVRFAFIDEGMTTTEKFMRFLSAADALLRAVGYFEVIYVSNSDLNFSDAETAFRRQFLSPVARRPSLFDADRQQESSAILPLDSVDHRPQFSTLLLRSSFPKLRRNAQGVLSGVHI